MKTSISQGRAAQFDKSSSPSVTAATYRQFQTWVVTYRLLQGLQPLH